MAYKSKFINVSAVPVKIHVIFSGNATIIFAVKITIYISQKKTMHLSYSHIIQLDSQIFNKFKNNDLKNHFFLGNFNEILLNLTNAHK
jgi:hypothetical protein